MPPTLETVTTDTYVRGSAPLPHLPCLHRIACPENGDIWRRKPGKEGGCAFLFVLPGDCSLGAHGLLRFRTDDVLLGTSGVGVCVSVVSNSSGMLHRFPELRPPFNPSVSCWKPSRWREVPSSQPGRPLYFLFTPERAQFCSRCLLRFDPAFSGSRLVRCSFSSRESSTENRKKKEAAGGGGGR